MRGGLREADEGGLIEVVDAHRVSATNKKKTAPGGGRNASL
jgi:hypothetical protein